MFSNVVSFIFAEFNTKSVKVKYGILTLKICRKIETPDLNNISEDVYLITVHLNATGGKEYNQKIPQAKIALRIVPGYGTTNVQFYDLINKNTNPITSEKISWKSIPGVSDYIQETLNSRMADIASRDEAVDNLALIIDLKSENLELKKQLNSLTDKLSKVVEISKLLIIEIQALKL